MSTPSKPMFEFKPKSFTKSKDFNPNTKALVNHALNHKLFPLALVQGDKRPVAKGWTNMTLEQSLDFIKEGNNIGVATGEKGGIFVIDIDAKESKDGENVIRDGLEEWNRLISIYGDVEAPTVVTGSGGLHIYFRYDSKVAGIKQGARMILNDYGERVGIDIRSNGGQVVYAGSIHCKTGNRYLWLEGRGLENYPTLPSVPDWFLNLLKEQKKEKPVHRYSTSTDVDDQVYEQVMKLFTSKHPEASDFVVRETSGNKIALDRIVSGFCSVCGRTHGDGSSKGDNALLTVVGKGQKVIFHCHQEKMSLGHLNPNQYSSVADLCDSGDEGFAELYCDIMRGQLVMVGEKGPAYLWNDRTKLWKAESIQTITSYISSQINPVIKAEVDQLYKIIAMVSKQGEEKKNSSSRSGNFRQSLKEEEEKKKLMEFMPPEWVWLNENKKAYMEKNLPVYMADLVEGFKEEDVVDWLETRFLSGGDVKLDPLFAPVDEEEEELFSMVNEKKAKLRTLKQESQNRFCVLQNAMMSLKNRRKVDNISKYIASFLKDEEFSKKLDSHERLLPIKGGKVINLETRQVMEREQKHFFTYEIDVSYNPTADRTFIEKFFRDIMLNNENKIQFLKQTLGYCLTGDTSERKFYILTGSGRNGKSELVKLLQRVLGKVAYKTASESVFAYQKNRGDLNPALANLKSARVVCCNEFERKPIDSAVIKTITGNDEVTYRKLYQDMETCRLVCKVFLISNAIPHVDTSQAMLDRLVILTFDTYFKESERAMVPEGIPEENVLPGDKDISLKLQTKENLEAFFSILVDEAHRYLQTKTIDYVPEVLEAVNEFKRERDIFELFVQNSCLFHPEYRCKSKDLLEAFNQFCRSYREPEWNSQRFGRKMSSLVSKGVVRMKNSDIFYSGIMVGEVCIHGVFQRDCLTCNLAALNPREHPIRG